VSLREKLVRLIPRDREFIVRLHRRVRYVRVGRLSQSAVILLAALALGWSVFATERHLSHETILAERNAQIRELENANEILSANLSEVRNKVEIQELSLTATQQTTIDLVAANQDLQFRIAELEGEVKDRRAQSQVLALSHMSALEAHADVAVDLENLELAQRDLKSKLAQRETQLSALDMERSSLNETVSAADAELQKLKEEVGTLNYARVDLIGRLNETHRDLQTVQKAKSRIVEEREGLGEQVVELSERLEMMETAQLDIVSRLGEQAGESGDSLKRTLEIAGLDVDHLLDRLDRSEDSGRGVGGPLLALEDTPGSGLASQIATVERRIDEFQSLQDLMERLPLAAPLDEFRVTSGFGRRIDPFNGRFAMHGGIDLASRRRAPVHVTSPGVVTFVGWKGGFGKIVEVDHGLGIRTRYAHLSSIFVKRGQKLEYREKVGQVGSTGRSSGEHLHYEVIVDGRSQNPANFMKAGQYVFKN
jgi:murein DD-endopeptidase MepM/ murein hydrolase activator NlpD